MEESLALEPDDSTAPLYRFDGCALPWLPRSERPREDEPGVQAARLARCTAGLAALDVPYCSKSPCCCAHLERAASTAERHSGFSVRR